MALFTSKADARLPLLTQFYQLVIPEPNDKRYPKETVEEWQAAGILKNSDPNGYELLEDGSAVLRDESYGLNLQEAPTELRTWTESIVLASYKKTFGTDEHGNINAEGLVMAGVQHTDLDRLGRMHSIFRRLMDAAADKHLPDEEDLVKFNEYRATIQIPPSTLVWRVIGTDKLLTYDYNPGLSTFRREVEIPLIEQLAEGVVSNCHHGPGRGAQYLGILRCEECKHPFVVTRYGPVSHQNTQRFCSHRCSDRNWRRKRRKEKKVSMSN